MVESIVGWCRGSVFTKFDGFVCAKEFKVFGQVKSNKARARRPAWTAFRRAALSTAGNGLMIIIQTTLLLTSIFLVGAMMVSGTLLSILHRLQGTAITGLIGSAPPIQKAALDRRALADWLRPLAAKADATSSSAPLATSHDQSWQPRAASIVLAAAGVSVRGSNLAFNGVWRFFNIFRESHFPGWI